MIKAKNIATGVITNVLNVSLENGVIIADARRPKKTSRFFESFPMMLPNGTSDDGRDILKLVDGYELVTTRTRKPRQPKVTQPERNRLQRWKSKHQQHRLSPNKKSKRSNKCRSRNKNPNRFQNRHRNRNK